MHGYLIHSYNSLQPFLAKRRNATSTVTLIDPQVCRLMYRAYSVVPCYSSIIFAFQVRLSVTLLTIRLLIF